MKNESIKYWYHSELEIIIKSLIHNDNYIKVPKGYKDLLIEYIPKLFDTSQQTENTINNIKKVCKAVEAYHQNKVIYRKVKTVGAFSIIDKGKKRKETIIHKTQKYKGNPKKGLTESIKLSQKLIDNLYSLGNTSENIKLRNLLLNFISNPSKYKSKGHLGEKRQTITAIKKSLQTMKLSDKNKTIEDFIVNLKKLKNG